MAHECIVSLGSNIQPHENIAAARRILQAETRLVALSRIIETLPDGYHAQPNFLNAALVIETTLERHAFKQYLKNVEQRLGRVKGPHPAGPRTMDLDIIVWDRAVVHNDYYNKSYVYGPVNEVLERLNILLPAPQQPWPISNKTE